MSDNLDAMLKFDAFQAAEELTGKSYKDDDQTAMVGIALATRHSRTCEEALTKLGDTPFSCPTDTYLRIVQEEGFKVIHKREHTVRSQNDPECQETHYLLWHEDGLLLSFDTYHGHRNSASVYFNWLSNDKSKSFPGGVSGGMAPPAGLNRMAVPDNMLVFSGHMDAREAIRYELSSLRKRGKFFKTWQYMDCCYLMAHWDWPKNSATSYASVDTDKHSALLIEHFPQHVKDAIACKPFNLHLLPHRLRVKLTNKPQHQPWRQDMHRQTYVRYR
jgi:hypothetical protein